ncbi:MAG: glycosyltransferase family 4 protein [Thermoanaerobaculaceae bacterium]
MNPPSLRVLVVATKSPWPSSGGGRIAVGALVDALEASGISVRVVAPAGAAHGQDGHYPLLRTVEVTPRPWLSVAGRRILGGSAVVSRWELGPLEVAVNDEIGRFRPDLVHVEQIHLGWLIPRLARRLPVLLRQQNVESDLLRQLARVSPPGIAWALRGEARALARFEADACRRAHLVAAISEFDAASLRCVAPDAHVEVLPPVAPAAPGANRERLEGDPPFLCLGSFDWWPNRDGARWLVRDVWPAIRRALPRARLHLAGPGSETIGRNVGGIVHRGFVVSSGPLYDQDATALIPVRAASGVRVRLLEAWAAGVPAVSTPIGVAGLSVCDGQGALVAEEAGRFAELAIRLASDQATRASLREAGKARLAEFTPERVVERARSLYLKAIGRSRAVIDS